MINHLIPASPGVISDIRGLELIIDSLKETVIYPLCLPHLFSSPSRLLSAPKGVMLYGLPGCSKTMLTKALARESGATFIKLHVSTLMEKWFGESQKLLPPREEVGRPRGYPTGFWSAEASTAAAAAGTCLPPAIGAATAPTDCRSATGLGASTSHG
ncbi:hypothetical protein HK405_013114 [Cladochytrium tenue]|nr:hypothetical protein HK405_013114 [Cladochytrium tenue]